MSSRSPSVSRIIEALDQSPAIVYVKDLHGRYLRVNDRYCEFFAVSAADISGHTDDQLAPQTTIDGPRTVSDDEPVQLEYTVAPHQSRPALAVWRFGVCEPGGELEAVCAVAAPVAEATMARGECARLMQAAAGEAAAETDHEAGRIQALHQASALAARRAHELMNDLLAEREQRGRAESELAEAQSQTDDLERALADARDRETELSRALQQHDPNELQRRIDHAQAALEQAQLRAGEAEATADGLREAQVALGAEHEALVAEHDRVAAERDRLAAERDRLAAERDRLAGERDQFAADRDGLSARHEALLAEHEQHAEKEREACAAQARDELTAERHALELEVSAAHARVAELEDAVAHQHRHTEELSAQLSATESELEATRKNSDRPAPVPTTEPLRWTPEAQLALTESLARASDWRTGVKAAIGALGSGGGWAAICAWRPEDRDQVASCFASWTADTDRLSEFETATWKRRQPLQGSCVGQALSSAESRWLVTDGEGDDPRLAALARQGIVGALLVPIRDGVNTMAALELASVSSAPPTAELVTAVEAVALQLGHFGHLLWLGSRPNWRVGRV